jgi:hypothetical protein
LSADQILIQNGSLMIPIGTAGAVAIWILKYQLKQWKEKAADKERLLRAEMKLEEYKAKNAQDMMDQIRATVSELATSIRHIDARLATVIPRIDALEKLYPLLRELISSLRVQRTSETVQIGKDATLVRTKKPGDGNHGG